MSETRSYSAIVRIDDPEVVGQYVTDFLSDPTTAELPLEVTGIEVTDTHAFSISTPSFTDSSAPRFATPLAETLTWKSNAQSTLETVIFGNMGRPGREGLTLTDGEVGVEAIRITGNRQHSAFNRLFKDSTVIHVPHLYLLTDRYADRTALTFEKNKRRSSHLLPLVGSLTLHRQTIR